MNLFAVTAIMKFMIAKVGNCITSSKVERSAVNRLVPGPSPGWCAEVSASGGCSASRYSKAVDAEHRLTSSKRVKSRGETPA